MVGPNAKFFWVKISDDQLNKESFDEYVRAGNLLRWFQTGEWKMSNVANILVKFDTRNEILADLKDEFFHYKLYNSGKLTGGTYNAE